MAERSDDRHVSDARQAEAERPTRERLESIINGIPEGIIVVDPEGGDTLHWNTAALRMHGYEYQQDALAFLASAVELFEVATLEGEVLPLDQWPIPRLLRGEEYEDYRLRLRRRADGWERTFSYFGTHIPDEAGLRTLALLSIRDITDQRHAEEVLGFRSVLLGSVSDSVIVYWRDGPDARRLVYVNAAAYVSRGYSQDEMLQMRAEDLVSPEVRPRLDEWLATLDERGRVTFESTHVRKDGTMFPVEASLRLIEYGGRRVVVNVSRDITERKLAEDRLTQELDTTNLLLEAADELGRSADVPEIAQTVADLAARLTGRHRSVVYLREGDGLRLAATTPPDIGGVPTLPFDWLSDKLRTLMATGGVDIIDHRKGQAPSKGAEEADSVMALLVALGKPPEVAGFLSVDDPGEAAYFDEREVDLVSGIAKQAAVAIENARLLQSERQARRIWSTLAAIGALLTTTVNLSEVMPEVLRRVCETLGSNGGVISQRAEGGWRTLYTYGVADGLNDFYTDDESPARVAVARTREPVAVDDVLTAPDVNAGLAQELGYRSYTAYPLLFRDEVIGVLTLFFPKPHVTFAEAEWEFVRRSLFTIASAQDNARLFEVQRESARLSQALNAIDAAVNSTQDFDEIMDRVIGETARAVDADSAVIYLRERERWTARYIHGLPPELIGRSFADEEVHYSALAASKGSAIVINDAASDGRVDKELVQRLGITAIMDVALRIEGEVLGDFALHYHSGDKRFTEAHADFVDKVAASVTLALRNARAYASEHTIADTLQKALLTLPEHIKGLRIGHLYRSATQAAEVGGDFYDVFELDGDRVGLLLGDVSGKGIEAAATTALVKNSIRAYAYETHSPAEVVRKTNELVVRSTEETAFITLFYGVLECSTGALRYCSAGHPPGIVHRLGGGTGVLISRSPLLGAFPALNYSEDEAVLGFGDVLVLYTDGAIEARRHGELYGEARLVKAVAELPTEPELIPREIHARILEFAGGTLSDDLALLAVSREGREETPAR